MSFYFANEIDNKRHSENSKTKHSKANEVHRLSGINYQLTDKQ